MSSTMSTDRKTAALRVPILPHTSPEADQPKGLKLPLRPHQLRALNRCLVIEEDGSLQNDFGHKFAFKSRGGCLADEVGTGKTATSIGLVLSGKGEGDTLVVAPKHLIPQWKHEIAKFVEQNAVEVLLGIKEYEKKGSYPSYKPRIVLVDSESVLNEKKLWYDWRRVFQGPNGPQIKVNSETMEKYKKGALFSVRSPKGPCSYTGWVFIGSLHMPQRPWRRVIFDEVQDLVEDGTESQKNLLQLTRTAQNVWLLSATPFPHGNRSVYANHELLGFCRLNMNVEVDHPLPPDHTFEIIKSKLYIRSPPHVRDQAVNTTVTRHTENVTSLDLEKRFYKLEEASIRDQNLSNDNKFSQAYNSLREMTVHPESSQELRKVFSKYSKKEYIRGVSTTVAGAAQRAVKQASSRLQEIRQLDLEGMQLECSNIAKSLRVVEKVKHFRSTTPLIASVFHGAITADTIRERKDKERKLIHDEYCSCDFPRGPACQANKSIHFRVIQEQDRWGRYIGPAFLTKLDDVSKYIVEDLEDERTIQYEERSINAMSQYLQIMKGLSTSKARKLEKYREEKRHLEMRIHTLEASADTAKDRDEDELAKRHGSKPAALTRYLQKIVDKGEQVIVFSFWHDTLKLIQQTLKKNKLDSVFCDGRSTATSIEKFTSGHVPIILLSAKSKASGANLQCATHVILLDPTGSSGEHGNTLEEQAIGRAVRMGQTQPVAVTRFCVTGTLEEDLFDEIDRAREKRNIRAMDTSYVIQSATKLAEKVEICEDCDIEVTAAMSKLDRLDQDLKEAEANGDVIELLDSDSEDEGSIQKDPEDAKRKAHPVAQSNNANVKQEPIHNTKRKEGAICDSQQKKRQCVDHEPVSRTRNTHTPSATGTTGATITPLTREVSTTPEETPTAKVHVYHENLGDAMVQQIAIKTEESGSPLLKTTTPKHQEDGLHRDKRPVLERMKELESIKSFITDSEYQNRKQAILDQI